MGANGGMFESSRLIHGDALSVLSSWPDECIDCCVTSPPYWGLRDYGVDGQLGLERTPEEYVGRLVEVFRELRRVLKPGGTLWLNLGDSYTSGGRKTRCPGKSKLHPAFEGDAYRDGLRPDTPPGLKPKDLVGIPWRVAFALQSDGWYLRSDIVVSKRNAMPESVRDRPTRAHEYVFLFSREPRYYYDSASVAEPVAPDTVDRYKRGRSENHKWADGGPGKQTIARTFDHMKQDGHGRRYAGFNEREFSRHPRTVRNLRSVWTVSTQPNPEAHFAVMPMVIAERCILAGCPSAGVVLDPFAGIGTTVMAAIKHGRIGVGVELNRAYVDEAQQRIARRYSLFAPETESARYVEATP